MRTAVFLLLLVALAGPATAGQPFGQPFVLGVGESVVLGDGEVSVGFNGVTSDSRCPLGVWCFWAGDAAAGLWLHTPGSASQEFVLHTFADFQTSIELGCYLVCLLAVAPYPVAGIGIDPDEYRVLLVVTVAATGAESRTWGRVKALYR